MFRAKVSEKKELTTGVELVHLELLEPNRIEFRSGQYVEVGEDKKRFYVASTPEMNHAVEVVADLGEFEIGDEVRFSEPGGEFVLDEVEEEMLVFVAEGRGIVPVRSMILDLLENGHEERMIKLHWGVGNLDQLFWEEELLQLTEEFGNLQVDVVVKRPPATGWELCSGEVEDCLLGHEEEWKSGYFYVCTSDERVDDIVEALEDLGVGEDQIQVERLSFSS